MTNAQLKHHILGNYLHANSGLGSVVSIMAPIEVTQAARAILPVLGPELTQPESFEHILCGVRD